MGVGFGETVPGILVVGAAVFVVTVVLCGAMPVITVALGDAVLTGCAVVVLVMLPEAVVFETVGAVLVGRTAEHVRFTAQPAACTSVTFVQWDWFSSLH